MSFQLTPTFSSKGHNPAAAGFLLAFKFFEQLALTRGQISRRANGDHDVEIAFASAVQAQ